MVCGLQDTYGIVCGLQYAYCMVCGLQYTYGMVWCVTIHIWYVVWVRLHIWCGVWVTVHIWYGVWVTVHIWYGVWVTVHIWYGVWLQYNFIQKIHFQFIADKSASLHSQICHSRYYPPMRRGITRAAILAAVLRPCLTCCPVGPRLRCCPSTSACKHTKPHSTLFTRLFPTMSHISSIAMCILICNIIYCILAVYTKKCPVLQWNPGHKFSLNSGFLVYVDIMCHTVNPYVATQSTSTMIQHICSNSSRHL